MTLLSADLLERELGEDISGHNDQTVACDCGKPVTLWEAIGVIQVLVGSLSCYCDHGTVKLGEDILKRYNAQKGGTR